MLAQGLVQLLQVGDQRPVAVDQLGEGGFLLVRLRRFQSAQAGDERDPGAEGRAQIVDRLGARDLDQPGPELVERDDQQLDGRRDFVEVPADVFPGLDWPRLDRLPIRRVLVEPLVRTVCSAVRRAIRSLSASTSARKERNLASS